MLGVMASNKMQAGLKSLLSGAPNTGNNNNSTLGQEKVASAVPGLSASPKVHADVPFEKMKVKIIGGRNLASKDVNGLSDPYLNIWCGSTGKYKTKIKYNTLNPVWDEEFTLPAASCKKKNLDIECWDHDTLCKDEFMGETSIPVDSIAVGQPINQWYKLQTNVSNKNKKGAVSGEICLEILKI